MYCEETAKEAAEHDHNTGGPYEQSCIFVHHARIRLKNHISVAAPLGDLYSNEQITH